MSHPTQSLNARPRSPLGTLDLWGSLTPSPALEHPRFHVALTASRAGLGWAGLGTRVSWSGAASPTPTSGRFSNLPGASPPSLPPTGRLPSPSLPLSADGAASTLGTKHRPRQPLQSSSPSSPASKQSPNLTHQLYLPNLSGPIPSPPPSPLQHPHPCPCQDLSRPPLSLSPGSSHSAMQAVGTCLQHTSHLPTRHPRRLLQHPVAPIKEGSWMGKV